MEMHQREDEIAKIDSSVRESPQSLLVGFALNTSQGPAASSGLDRVFSAFRRFRRAVHLRTDSLALFLSLTPSLSFVDCDALSLTYASQHGSGQLTVIWRRNARLKTRIILKVLD